MGLLFDAGFRVISVTHPRQDFKLITKNNISKLEFQKAEIILSVFDFLNLEKVNVVAHSERSYKLKCSYSGAYKVVNV